MGDKSPLRRVLATFLLKIDGSAPSVDFAEKWDDMTPPPRVYIVILNYFLFFGKDKNIYEKELERFSYDLEMKTRKQNKKTNERK